MKTQNKISVVSDSVNKKIKGKQYYYMHSMDCNIYITVCDNCKKEVGGWTSNEADKLWEEHSCS
jgi:hypothetical protein